MSSKFLSDNEITDMFDREKIDVYRNQGGTAGFAKHLGCDMSKGLSQEEVDRNLEKYGANVLPDPPTQTWFEMFFEAFEDTTLRILIASAILSVVLTTCFTRPLGFEDYIETISIFVAVLLVSATQTQTNYSQQKAFLEINKLKNSFEVNVIRDGKEVQVKSTDVVRGDVLSLKGGDAIAADCLYITGQDMKVNNSAQTGESDAIPISEKHPFILGGSACDSGFCRALVVAIGPHTRSGQMMMKIQNLESDKKKEKSPLEAKLEDVAKSLTMLGLAGAFLTFVVLMAYWLAHLRTCIVIGISITTILPDLVDKIMTSVTIFICAVPEGLPLAVTLSLGFSMKRMMDDQNFVRNLSACETMGGATTICSDKTGTLTENKMTVVQFYQIGSEPQSKRPEITDKVRDIWTKAVCVNSTAFKTKTTEKKKVGKEIEEIVKEEYVGSASECALLQLVEQLGDDYVKVREENKPVYVHEFSSARKKMSSVVKSKDGSCRVYFKGGPDYVLGLCTHYLDKNFEIKPIGDKKDHIMSTLDKFADKSLRTMLVGYRDLKGSEAEESFYKVAENIEKNIVVIGIVGIQDPLRPEVIQAVKNCRSAGVVVRMVTGDYIKTAKAIAKECGILDESKGETAIEGREFAELDKIQMLERVPNLRVMARSSPMDKLKLVSFLMEMGEVVAATGDGSNDSPALKQADVGLSMGRCGTELARMASDIVILDDNFNSIVSALKWGRCVYDNVRGFLQFQLTVNLAAMFVAFIGSIALHDSPLKTIQLLWVNLIMDSLGALALATRGPSDILLERPPYGRGDTLVNNVLTRNISGHVIYQICVLFLLLFGYEDVLGLNYDENPIAVAGQPTEDEKERIMSGLIFNTFVLMQVFNLPNARLAGQDMSFFDGLFSNLYFVVIFFTIIVTQVLIVLFAGGAFGFMKQSGTQWALAFSFGLGSLVVGAFVRLFRLKDHTSDNLNSLREARKKQIRNVYYNLSKEEQFERHIGPSGDVILDCEVKKDV